MKNLKQAIYALIYKVKQFLSTMRDKIKQIFCVLFGHSLIQTTCFGYYHCARCGMLVGDKLGGYYDDSKVVVVGHNCPICKENYKKLTWKNKLLCPNPFTQEGKS